MVSKLTGPIPLPEINAARERIGGAVLKTPIIRLDADDILPSGTEIFLKLESLQPVRSFKLRGALNAMLKAGPELLEDGVWTVSSGNMAQAVAWSARKLGVACSVLVPDTTPPIKLKSIERYGANPVKRPFSELEEIWQTGRSDGARGLLVHPFSDADVMAANGTIGLEILDDMPDFDTVVAPWGGGGLCCGLASALRARGSKTRIIASEIDAVAPLVAAFEEGQPTSLTFVPTFVDGIGAPFINPEMFQLAEQLIDGSVAVSLDETAAAIRLVMQRAGVACEGAAATAIAVAISGKAGPGKVLCVLSGANIETAKLEKILSGGMPA